MMVTSYLSKTATALALLGLGICVVACSSPPEPPQPQGEKVQINTVEVMRYTAPMVSKQTYIDAASMSHTSVHGENSRDLGGLVSDANGGR